MVALYHYREAVAGLWHDVPATLYHYCPTEKLRYLLEPGADLKCKYLSFQGDREEYRFGAKLLCDFIRQQGTCYQMAGDRIESCLVDNIGYVGKQISGPQIPLTFSFTERVDSEYHYNEYCKQGGCAIAFSQERLDHACDKVIERGTSLRLLRCLYQGRDGAKIETLCRGFWFDQSKNIDRLIESNYLDEEAGKLVLAEICSIAPHFKRKRFVDDNEWRLVMVSQEWRDVDDEGFLATGLRDATLHNDLIELMEGVAVRRCEVRDKTMRELSKFALQQRDRNFRVWV